MWDNIAKQCFVKTILVVKNMNATIVGLKKVLFSFLDFRIRKNRHRFMTKTCFLQKIFITRKQVK